MTSDDAGDLDALIAQLEASVHAARLALHREQRRVAWSLALDRLATVAVVIVAGSAFLAAAAPLPSRVKAPFTVTNDKGVIVEVGEKPFPYLIVFRPSGTRAVGAIAADQPRMNLWAPDGSPQAVMGIVGRTKPTITLRYDGKDRLSVLGSESPEINLTNLDGLGVVSLAVDSTRSGTLRLGDAKGNAMVNAFTTLNGTGAVQTYPNGNSAARTFFGLPGTYICGVGC